MLSFIICFALFFCVCSFSCCFDLVPIELLISLYEYYNIFELISFSSSALLYCHLCLSDPDLVSDLESAIWQFVVALVVLVIILLGIVRSEFIDEL